MGISVPEQFSNVTVTCKANVYFGGKVVSHAITLADGSRKTLGVILPGEFKFDTQAPERMEIVTGSCRVRLAGESDWRTVQGGAFFDVPGNSAFEIAVQEGAVDYICTFG